MVKTWCKHYRGMANFETCKAGVTYKQLPCVKTFFSGPCFEPGEGCDKAEYPTAEELAAREAEMHARFDSLGGPWKRGTAGASGVIDCPACGCKESLQFIRAGYNGHIHARCKTDDCVAWME